MTSILIAVAIMLGILTTSDDPNNLSNEHQDAIERIVIEDIQQV